MQESTNDKYILQSVANTLDVLDILSKEDALTVPEIASRMGLSKSSVFRILATLESRRFVHKSADARYSLDIKLVVLGSSVVNRLDILRFGHPMLMELTSHTGETSHLGMLDNDIYVRVVDKVLSPSTIRTDSYIGFGRSAHLMACGKVILAFKPQSFLDAYAKVADMRPLTTYSITSAEQLRRELQQIRQNGYAIDREESEYGLFCIAAPVFDANHNVIAGISISGPAERMKSNFNANLPLVLETAKQISASIE